MKLELETLARIHSPYPELFGIPRQSLLAKTSISTLKFSHPNLDQNYFQGIEDSKYLWLIFAFDRLKNKKDSGLVRPPRLGGNQKRGVFSTRSPFRPNPLGLSLVEFVSFSSDKLEMKIRGADLLDGTPILDIKPYHPEVDQPSEVPKSWINQTPFHQNKVHWDETAKLKTKPIHREFIEEHLALGIEPAYQSGDREYGVSYFNLNIRYHYENPQHIRITDVSHQD